MNTTALPTLGLFGFGAFGRLISHHLSRYFDIRVYDPGLGERLLPENVTRASLAEAAGCSVVVLAMPVMKMAQSLAQIVPHLTRGALVLDVGSVKVATAKVMAALIPAEFDVVATHPLFGPQSAQDGLKGLKIALCPIHGKRHMEVAAFLRKALGLEVVLTSPEEHDAELALVQGVTHLIAKILTRMEPLPTQMTTRSFERIIEAIAMVRDDAPEVFHAIEVANPYAAGVRAQFFDVARELDLELGRLTARDRWTP